MTFFFQVHNPEYPLDKRSKTLSKEDEVFLITKNGDDKVKQVDDYYLFQDAFMEIDP